MKMLKLAVEKGIKHSPLLLFLIATFLYSLFSVLRHNNFQSFGYDLGVYDQAVWLYSKFQTPFSTIKFPNMILLADHFGPSLALLSPIYWINDTVILLLLAQAVLFTISGYPIYQISKIFIKNTLKSSIILFAYYFFWGIQLAIGFDFHLITVASAVLPWLFYFSLSKKWSLYFLTLIIFLGFKEDAAIIASTLGIFIILTCKNIKMGIATILISATWFLVVTKVLMTENILGQPFAYSVDFPKSFKEFLGIFFTPFGPKWKTILLCLIPFAALPVIEKGTLIMIAGHFLIHFLDPKLFGRWDISMHYRAPLASILAVGAIISLSKIKNKYVSKIAILIIFSGTIFTQIYLHAPLNMLLKPAFYQTSSWEGDINNLISKIPANASVATQNNIIPHLSHRKYIYYFRIEDKGILTDQQVSQNKSISPCGRATCWWINSFGSEYILIDLHEGQLSNNFWDKNEKQAKEAMEVLISLKEYNIVDKSGDAYLLKKAK